MTELSDHGSLASLRSSSLRSPLRFSSGALATVLTVVLAAILLPMPLFLERVSDFLGHVFLVVLGQHAVSLEHAGAVECTFGHDPLAFTEEVWQQSLIGDPNCVLAVGHVKTDLEIVATLDAAFLDEATEPDARTSGDMLFCYVGG